MPSQFSSCPDRISFLGEEYFNMFRVQMCKEHLSLASEAHLIQLRSNFLRFVLSYIMSLVFMIFLAFIHLSAVVGNLQMLLSCFKDEKKYSFLQRGRRFLIIQWVCQVTILVADTVESWKAFASHLKKSCNIFRFLSLSVLFF